MAARVTRSPDDTALVETPVELNDDLATTVVIDQLELTNVPCTSSVSSKNPAADKIPSLRAFGETDRTNAHLI
jgi:hypothetical protein